MFPRAYTALLPETSANCTLYAKFNIKTRTYYSNNRKAFGAATKTARQTRVSTPPGRYQAAD